MKYTSCFLDYVYFKRRFSKRVSPLRRNGEEGEEGRRGMSKLINGKALKASSFKVDIIEKNPSNSP